MKRTTPLVLLLGLLLGASIMFLFKIPVNVDCPQPECPEPQVNTECPEPQISTSCPEPEVNTDCPDCDKGLFKRMLEAQAENHIYKLNKYDCSDYSQELARRLENKGFDAETKTINVDCSASRWDCEKYSGRHMIVEVDDLYIESITGNVIDPQIYDEYNLR